MRDSWEDDATMLAVKSGKTWNHAHADAGPNSDRFSRYFRHFLWQDDVIWIIDDLKSHERGSIHGYGIRAVQTR